MTAKSRFTRLAALGSVAGVLLLSGAPLRAQEAAPEQERAERPELPPLPSQIPPDEALAAIKRRAKKSLDARRAARR
ncbi:MAG: hypothetical protein Q8R91_09650, partial [Candidatus Omnitrophota bacterium]|nr:hypothetical protein [Candidatus Omnitrophota bacterium]